MGFFPGILIGAISTLLLLSLWKTPPHSVYITQEGRILLREPDPWLVGKPHQAVLGKENKPSLSSGSLRRSSSSISHGAQDDCNNTHLHPLPAPKGKHHLLLILIHSTPQGLAMRKAVRQSWLRDNDKEGRFLARFVIGVGGLNRDVLRELACENRDHGDLLLLPNITEPAVDTKYSSSEKLLQSFIWAENNVEFSYLFKCTDSTFVILDRLLGDLEGRGGRTEMDYLWGFFAGGIEASRDTNSHLGEINWFLCSHYVPYPQGGGYVISHGLVSILKKLSIYLEHYSHDDIALGVWLSPFNGIYRRHDVSFNTGYYSRGCNNAYVVTHRESPENMLKKFKMVTEKGFLCEKEYVGRPSYHYNWTAPASRCCIRESGVP